MIIINLSQKKNPIKIEKNIEKGFGLYKSLESKHSKGSIQSETPKKKGGFFSSMFNEIKNNIDTDSIKSSLNQVKEDFQKGMEISKGKSPSIQNPQEVQTKKTNSKRRKFLTPKKCFGEGFVN